MLVHKLPELCEITDEEWINPALFERLSITSDVTSYALPLARDTHLMKRCIAGTWKVKNMGQGDEEVTEQTPAAESVSSSTGNVQKKAMPWVGLTPTDAIDADVVDDVMSTKKGRTGDMIVVASLIDKIPNLGGMKTLHYFSSSV